MDSFLLFAAVGFAAQLADGALGMGFGVISSAILLAQGVPPPLVSASVNAAKIPTGAAASLAHWRAGNLDRRLVLGLAAGGVVGGIAGALLLTGLKGQALDLVVLGYLLLMAALILWRAALGRPARILGRQASAGIGAAGGLIEGIGGSWGPVVTSSLVGAGIEPRRAIGSSALAETAVSVTVFAVLAAGFGAGLWGEGMHLHALLLPVAGLIAGGLPAAALGGWLAARAPRRALMLGVGLLVLAVALWRGWRLFGG